MKMINVHEAKTHLSRLIDEIVMFGEPLIIAKSGKPLVKVIPFDNHQKTTKRIGFAPELSIPEDFNDMNEEEISALFEGKEK
ncbi:type II toxin-antitoxin system Phd/YefM family antitoxin [Pelistega suis]|uniref:Antitoxin n=1 Tax=Pelistega suis TaxID=1631957 RepID=A0A849P5N1_9BURK|nr:type II toxin-antitoxin system prevent-host-death family antitoxin [Pelistega suis]MCQ9329006.1 type II toxin-antitoxin system prevent-host-death family antitoxin [Pelistega suis]NOL51092.1 type II toxin-antitoxin system prevent-host-death family antitoxin [Pelistega suis]